MSRGLQALGLEAGSKSLGGIDEIEIHPAVREPASASSANATSECALIAGFSSTRTRLKLK
jgi:hypothetical protein